MADDDVVEQFNPFSVIDSKENQKLLQHGKDLTVTLLNHPDARIKSIAEAMQLKKNVAKDFIKLLLYIIKLFLSAIEDGTITMQNSARRAAIEELSHKSLILHHVRKDFCSAKDNSSLNHSVAIVIGCATKVRDVIKSLQKKHWLRCFRSAKNISAMIPIFERINERVTGIQSIDCRPFCELLGDVVELKYSLINTEKRILHISSVGVASGIATVIVGGALFVIIPIGIPLIIAGAAGISTSAAVGSAATKRLNLAKAKGNLKGNKFVCKKEIKELS